jgi:hypothetical protein
MTSDLPIRLARATFNQALAQANISAIKPLLAEQAQLITGTDSAIISGRKAQLQAWKREFAAPAAQRTTYIRTPETITLSTTDPIAMETGHWRGEQNGQITPQITAKGTYAAKWRNLQPHAPSPQWVIESEIFVTLA